MTMTTPRAWSFLTNHAQVLVCIAHDPDIRLREIGESVRNNRAGSAPHRRRTRRRRLHHARALRPPQSLHHPAKPAPPRSARARRMTTSSRSGGRNCGSAWAAAIFSRVMRVRSSRSRDVVIVAISALRERSGSGRSGRGRPRAWRRARARNDGRRAQPRSRWCAPMRPSVVGRADGPDALAAREPRGRERADVRGENRRSA